MGADGRLAVAAACVELLLSGGGCAGGMVLPAFEFFLDESRKRD